MRISILFLLAFAHIVPVCGQDCTFKLFAENGMLNQSAANYGRYLFLVSDGLESVTLYDLKKKAIISTCRLVGHKERNGSDIVYHCNQSNFGRDRYESSDFFPLLYVSQRNENDSLGAFLSVLRIVPHYHKKNEISSITVIPVQKIFFPVMTNNNCMGNPNAVIDVNRGFLYTYSRNNRKADNYLDAVISKFYIPRLYDKDNKIKKVVVLTDDDILESFSCGFSLLNAQGGFFRKNRLYIVQGYPSKKKELNYVFFRTIDLKKRKLIKTVDMLNNGFNTEPEGCWYYKGHVMLTNNGKSIYKLTGNKYKVK